MITSLWVSNSFSLAEIEFFKFSAINCFIKGRHKMRLSIRPLNLLQAVPFVNKWRIMRTNCYPFFSLALRTNSRNGLLIPAIVISLAILVNPLQARAEQDRQAGAMPQQGLRKLIGNGAYGVTRNGQLLDSANLNRPLIPASIIKLLTGLAAFDQLGADYRFRTELFIDEANHLYVKGFGDPFLVSEEIAIIMTSLKRSGTKIINDIYIDDSSYQLESNCISISYLLRS